MIKINTDVIEDAIGRILEAIGEDRNRQGLVDTPKRVAKMYSEIFSGIGVDLDKQLQVTFDESYEDMVIVKDIPMQSICEHHLLPFFGHAHIVYIHKNNVITGLSKLVRLVDVACKKPQLFYKNALSPEAAFDAWKKYYDMPEAALMLAKRLTMKKCFSLSTQIFLSKEEKSMIPGDFICEECEVSMHELNIVIG